jgi:hypothetical protein
MRDAQRVQPGFVGVGHIDQSQIRQRSLVPRGRLQEREGEIDAAHPKRQRRRGSAPPPRATWKT